MKKCKTCKYIIHGKERVYFMDVHQDYDISLCKRQPKEVRKQPDDWCWEYKKIKNPPK